MATYSNAQLISFFKQWEPKVQYFGIAIIPNGFFKFYKQGRDLVKAEAAAKVEAERAARRRGNPYLRDELSFIVHGYVRTNNPSRVADEFMAAFPETLHSRESVRSCSGQLRSLDNLCPDDTGWTVKSLVAEVATELYPERFAA